MAAPRSSLRPALPRSVAKCIACPEVMPFAFTESVKLPTGRTILLLSPTGETVGHASERDGSVAHCLACWDRLAGR